MPTKTTAKPEPDTAGPEPSQPDATPEPLAAGTIEPLGNRHYLIGLDAPEDVTAGVPFGFVDLPETPPESGVVVLGYCGRESTEAGLYVADVQTVPDGPDAGRPRALIAACTQPEAGLHLRFVLVAL